MRSHIEEQFSIFLHNLAETLDIPQSLYEDAKERYTSVGKWLSNENSILFEHTPDIYPQGSFNLGTVVKPISNQDEYDIDLVCELNLSKRNITQKQLKQMVGDQLKRNSNYNRMLDNEGRRCWTINYADGVNFHMDILPAIPDDDFRRKLLDLKVREELSKHGICITDNENEDYSIVSNNWNCSNPKGYAEWFRSCMRERFEEQRSIIMKEQNIEQVPDYLIKTPLQRIVQILKRHRDIMFEHDQDDKPISIIITTLAGLSYRNESDMLEAYWNIINGMIDMFERSNGKIKNPVNPEENFADKWIEHPQRAVKFKKWLLQVKSDVNTAFENTNIRDVINELMPSFGERAVKLAASEAGIIMASTAPHIKKSTTTQPWSPYVKASQDKLIYSQYEELIASYPGLKLEKNNEDIWIIKGKLVFKVTINEETIDDEYQVEIILKEFPNKPPLVKETGGRIAEDFHPGKNGTRCLEVPLELNKRFKENPTIKGFVENLLLDHLYAWSYKDKHGVLPFGEHSHGGEGILEYYKKEFDVDDVSLVLGLLKILVDNNYRGHQLCPCDSGLKLRKCHGKKLLEIKDIQTSEEFLYEYFEIAQFLKRKYNKYLPEELIPKAFYTFK